MEKHDLITFKQEVSLIKITHQCRKLLEILVLPRPLPKKIFSFNASLSMHLIENSLRTISFGFY